MHSIDAEPASEQLFQRSGELVGAAGAAAGAVYALEAGDDIGDLHSDAKGADSLGVAVATAGVLHLADDVALGLDVDALGAHRHAGCERSFADATLGDVAKQCYVVHIATLLPG